MQTDLWTMTRVILGLTRPGDATATVRALQVLEVAERGEPVERCFHEWEEEEALAFYREATTTLAADPAAEALWPALTAMHAAIAAELDRRQARVVPEVGQRLVVRKRDGHEARAVVQRVTETGVSLLVRGWTPWAVEELSLGRWREMWERGEARQLRGEADEFGLLPPATVILGLREAQGCLDDLVAGMDETVEAGRDNLRTLERAIEAGRERVWGATPTLEALPPAFGGGALRQRLIAVLEVEEDAVDDDRLCALVADAYLRSSELEEIRDHFGLSHDLPVAETVTRGVLIRESIVGELLDAMRAERSDVTTANCLTVGATQEIARAVLDQDSLERVCDVFGWDKGAHADDLARFAEELHQGYETLKAIAAQVGRDDDYGRFKHQEVSDAVRNLVEDERERVIEDDQLDSAIKVLEWHGLDRREMEKEARRLRDMGEAFDQIADLLGMAGAANGRPEEVAGKVEDLLEKRHEMVRVAEDLNNAHSVLRDWIDGTRQKDRGF